MELKIDLNRKDVIIINWLATILTPINPILFLAFAIFFAYSGIDLSMLELTGFNFLVFIINILIYFVSMLLFVFGWSAIFCLLNPKLRKGVIGEHIFQITDSGLIESTDYNRTEYSWSSLDKVKSALGLILIRVAGNQWHGIPTRFFPSNNERDSFLDELNKRILV